MIKHCFVFIFVVCISSIWAESARETVFLIHGLRGNTEDMETIADYLEKADYSVVNIDYPSKDHPIQILAEDFLLPEVSKQLTEKPAKIHFVTHSMGGIVLRCFLKDHAVEIDSLLGRSVMIAPPNKGSEVTEFFQKTYPYKKRYGVAGQQLGFDIEEQVGLNDSVNFALGIIAGTTSQFPFFSWFIPGKDDGKISTQRTKIKGMADYLEMPFPHDTIMKKAEVVEKTKFFLREGRF